MKTLCAIAYFTFVIFNAHIYAQETFQKIIKGGDEDVTWAIQGTRNGEFVISGFTKSYGQGDRDVLLLKINSKGDTIFRKLMGAVLAIGQHQLIPVMMKGI